MAARVACSPLTLAKNPLNVFCRSTTCKTMAMLHQVCEHTNVLLRLTVKA